MALFSRKNLKQNPFGLTETDLIGDLEGFQMGVVVRMLEEQELQGNKPDVNVFQESIRVDKSDGGFNWDETGAHLIFWSSVIRYREWKKFFERYPEYKIYNLD